jgi:NADPH-dependent 2,4-dienoyl-CoA reductase/sulfur reductase-like enzyme/pSer/pThr/pTyr-binding forkhead associated (FHA) protein
MARARYVVIGEGAAGLAAAHELRRLSPHAAIGLFTDEPHPGYFRAALTNFLLGELREDQLWVNPPDFYDTWGIRRAFARVVAVDPARGLLWDSSSSEPTAFDGLLVASGARPRPPPFQGGLLPGVVTLRTLHDARRLMDWLRLGRLERAVVLGGGPLGLEWAQALLERGVQVCLIERAPRLLPGSLDEVASDLLALRLRQAGIEVVLGDQVVNAYPDASGNVAGVRLASGRDIPGALVAVALGVVPNTDFLRGSGLALAPEGALLVNRSLMASAPRIWAAGDVARVEGEQIALWEPARRQGRIAAQNMLGGSALYEPGAFYFATRLFDLDFARVGDVARGPGREEVVDLPRGTGTIAYRKLVLENGRLLGALMLGERAMRVRAFGRTLKRLVDARADLSSIKDRVWTASFDLDAWLETRKLLEKPRVVTSEARVVPARVRGTQAVRLSSAGTSLLSNQGTTLLPSSRHGGASPRTSILPSSAKPLAAGTGEMQMPPSAGSYTGAMQMTPNTRGTRQLSIGLPAELAVAPAAARALATEAWLERDGGRVRLEHAITNLGAAPEAHVVLRAPRAGALHAQIVDHDGAYYLRDMGSHIGTYLNGDPLTGVQRLKTGDRVQIGGETFIFRGGDERAGTAAGRGQAAPRLMVRSGAHFGLRLRLGAQPIVIGQSPGAQLQLAEAGVAPEHARVRFDGQRYFVEALTPMASTSVAGQPLAVGEARALTEGSVIELGSVELIYSEVPAEDAGRALCPTLRVTVDAGPNAGQVALLRGRGVLGSGQGASLVIAGLTPAHLEIVEHKSVYFVRDLSGGQSFRKGRPLGTDFVPLEHGDLLLAGSGVMLRVEET